jgi:hypothetical protein
LGSASKPISDRTSALRRSGRSSVGARPQRPRQEGALSA